MEKSRKRLRVCLFFLLLTAILAGCLYYYFSDIRNTGEIEGGVLVRKAKANMERMIG